MIRLSETFHWMFEDDGWRPKILLQGLILLIPVIGLIALLGWMMLCCDNLREGRQDLARFGFPLRRGVKLLVVALVYWVGLALPYTGLRLVAETVPSSAALATLVQAYNYVGLLLFALLVVPVFVATDEGGVRAGINVGRVVSSMIQTPLRTLIAGLVVIAASAVGFLGFAILIAAPFTITYGASVVASIAAWWAAAQAGEMPAATVPLDPVLLIAEPPEPEA